MKVGTVLCTKDSQRLTNAILVSHDTEKGICKVLTDFGNLVEIAQEDLTKYYEVSDNWIWCIENEYPLPNIKDRIREQIELLQNALEKVE